jgi:hypothetical protein
MTSLTLTAQEHSALLRVLRKYLAETHWTRHASRHFPPEQLAQLEQERELCQRIINAA